MDRWFLPASPPIFRNPELQHRRQIPELHLPACSAPIGLCQVPGRGDALVQHTARNRRGQAAGMMRRSIRLVSLVTAGLATSGGFIYGAHSWDPSDFGVVRIGRAVLTTAAITCDYLMTLRRVPPATQEYDIIISQVHARSARRLLDLCCANRGTYIKLGQHLGALEYLLPPEYTSTLGVLHSRAPSTPLPDVLHIIQEELGKETSELFAHFEETPLGAASLAQVHRAVLRDGQTVAVKVQHPKVRKQSSRDILIMEILLQVVKAVFPQFEFMWLVEEAKKNLPQELDFLTEARNAEKMAHMVRKFPSLKIPRIHWDLSTERVLVMEYMEGGQANDLQYMKRNNIDVDQAQEIRSNAAAYLPQISQLLASVPRQMLLLLKTNDLLRGIETALHTNASASSFLSMSRCCIRAVARHRRQTATSCWFYAHISISESLHLGQLQLYELLLWARTTRLQRWLTLLVHWISHSIWTSPGDLQPTEGLAIA
ncbi:aarF domain-containing protein kinase 1 isoform X4 [Bufo bufo]|uniref:aarF domain-containing protein kinase 1 isoform X4 n=1 Tax=Bufo bufo TaxID=8384 RepID=UPI001ABE19D6|nr:aarF domain-containing protein kinase 1 isoform X4 [Bufo bufo]